MKPIEVNMALAQKLLKIIKKRLKNMDMLNI
jgi:hypothetical protein